MYLKYTMLKLKVYTIWYIACDSIFDKIDTVSVIDTFIEIKGKFP